MFGSRPRPSFDSRSRRRALAAVAAIGIAGGHLLVLLLLNRTEPRLAPGPQPEASRPDFIVRLEEPRRAAPPPRRKKTEPPVPATRNPPPRPTAQPAIAAAPAPQPTPAAPSYGRWTVAPEASSAQPPLVSGLAGCTMQSLPTLTGAARDACAKRLSEMAKNAPALPLIGDKRKADELQEQADYQNAVRDWKRSTAMGPHPCPPQHEPKHKLYLDKCSLVNAARLDSGPGVGNAADRHQGAAVKVEFKMKF